MERSYTREDLQRAAPRVLERLRQMAELPTYGTVAGQAVASLFWEELGHPARGPINDIDVFVNYNLPRPLRGMEDLPPERGKVSALGRSQATINHLNELGVEEQHRYNHVKFIALRSTTSIMRTYRVGLVNYTLVSSVLNRPDAWGHDQAVSQVLVDGFDLNLVSVGINLESGLVVASPGFMDFLNTNRIQVQTCNTPAHTLVRLARKCFGGQIHGASCDYAQERALLELALACHANPHPGIYSAPIVFGARYKQSYDEFAAHLPPCEATQSSSLGEGSYTFHKLVVSPPTSGDDLSLFSLGGEDSDFTNALRRMVFVNYFPQIYSLYHPDRSILPPSEIAARRAAFEQLDQGKDECHNLSCLQRALGKPSVNIPMEGMDEQDSFVFFFNEDCARDPALIQQVVATWESMPVMDRAVIQSLRQRADIVLEFKQDRKLAWTSLFDEFGSKAMLSITALPGPLAHAALSQLLDWIQEMGARAATLLSQLVPVHHMGAQGSPLEELLEVIDPRHRAQMAHRLMGLAQPGWPAMADADPQVRAGAVALWAIATDEPLPAQVFSHVHDREIPQLLECLGQCLRYARLSSPNKQANLTDAFQRLVPRLNQEQLLANDARLVRMLLCLDAFHLLRPHLDNATLDRTKNSLLAAHPTCSSWGELVQELRQSSAAYALPVSGSDLEQSQDLWRQVINPGRAAADIEEALLEGPAILNPTVKRGPRL